MNFKVKKMSFASRFLCVAMCLLMTAPIAVIGLADDPSDPLEVFTITYTKTTGGGAEVLGFFEKTENHVTKVSVYSFNAGDTYIIKPLADPNYSISSVRVNGTAMQINDGEVTGVITENLVIEVEFAVVPQYFVALDVNNSTGKSATVKINNQVVTGSTFQANSTSANAIKVELPSGYMVSQMYLTAPGTQRRDIAVTNNEGSAPAIINGTYTLHIVVVKTCNAIVTSGDNGSINITSGAYPQGKSVEIVLTPKQGYTAKLVIDGVTVQLTSNKYNYTINANCIITASFVPAVTNATVTITNDPLFGTLSAPGFSILANKMSLPVGSVVTLNITPAADYMVSKVKFGTEELEIKDNTVTFTASKDASLVITYIKRYRITSVVTGSVGGKIEVKDYVLSGSYVFIPEGGTAEFSFIPDLGYKIGRVKVDGAEVSLTNGKYTLSDMNKNHTVSVTFEHDGTGEKTFEITATALANGSITPSGVQQVTEGHNLSFTITPDDDYEVDYVQVNGADVSLVDGKYEFKNVAANYTIKAVFKKQGSLSSGIKVSDIDWNADKVLISLNGGTTVTREVFEKLMGDSAAKSSEFSETNFSWSIPSNPTFVITSGNVDMMVRRDSGTNFASIEDSLADLGISGQHVVLTCPQAITLPADTTLRASLGTALLNSQVIMYYYRDGVLIRTNDLVSVDAAGWVIVDNYGGGDLVFVEQGGTQSYNITVVVGEDEQGTVTPNSKEAPITVQSGSSISLLIEANEGYVIDKIFLDGTEIEVPKESKASYNYTIDSVKKNHSVEVTFVEEGEESGGNAGLIISIIVIVLALSGGGVLFYFKWKQSRF